MRAEVRVNMGNLLLSLSDAMDLASPDLVQHQQRTAFVAWEIGKVAGLPDDTVADLFAAALLHDVGALSLEDKISLVTGQTLDLEKHCIRGEFLLRQVPLLQTAATAVRFHHRDWDHWSESIELPHVLGSQILSLADRVDRLTDRGRYILSQSDEITSQIAALSGTALHPLIVDWFKALRGREEFWFDLVSPRLYSLLLEEGPYGAVEIDLSSVWPLAELIRNMIDFRSRFTATHTSGVAECATTLAEWFGLSEMECALLGVAGNLHDLGKLVVPNTILEKPGKLDAAELSNCQMAVMKQHTYFTYMVLRTVAGLRQVAEWAAFHHEKLDGSGYPFHVSANGISTCARLVAVADKFTALAEARPYRGPMEPGQIARIFKEDARQGLLDAQAIDLILHNQDEITKRVRQKEALAKAVYEQQASLALAA